MKRILAGLAAVSMILTGCSSKDDATRFMMETTSNGQTLYSLHDVEGNKYTENNYKTYKEVVDAGYIVTDTKDKTTAINNSGKTVIKDGIYKTISGSHSYFIGNTNEESSLSFKEAAMTMTELDEEKLKLNGVGEKDKVTYTSSNEKAVLVEKNGTAKAVGEGKALITATVGNKSVHTTITVKALSPFISTDTLSMKVGEKTTLSVNNTAGHKAKWSSSDKKIATVGKNGGVKALKKGTVKITATIAKSIKLTCTITITPKTVKMNKETLTLTAGKKAKLKVSNKKKKSKVKWSTSDKKIATVKKGEVKAVKAGTATITATVGKKKYTCKVTVTKRVVKLNKTSLTLGKTEEATLKVTGKKKKSKVKWSTSDKKIATVSKGKITAKKAGTVTITATVEKKKLTCKVTVKSYKPELNKKKVELDIGDTYNLEIKHLEGRKVTYESHNKTIASVSKKGVITAESAGTATIAVTVGKTKLICDVVVSKKVLSLNKKEESLIKGETLKLKVNNLEGQHVIWTSDAPKVASVDDKGKVTTHAAGVANVTATINQENFTCKITVARDEKKLVSTQSVPAYTSGIDIIDSTGKKIYEASDKLAIKPTGLPVLVENGTYKVLYDEDTDLYEGSNEVMYVLVNDDASVITVAFSNYMQIYFPKESTEDYLKVKTLGNYSIVASDSKHLVLYDSTNQAIVTADNKTKKAFLVDMKIDSAEIKDGEIIIHNDENNYLVSTLGTLVNINSYYKDTSHYIERNEGVVYGPHIIHKGKNKVTLKKVQLNPATVHMTGKYFPGYIKGKGFYFFDFSGKQVFDTVYLAASAFDKNDRAIVLGQKGYYSLIDDTGKAIISGKISKIETIDNEFYAVYNSTNAFKVYDKDGNLVLKDEFTSYTDNALVSYNDAKYLTLTKNGRSYVYNMDHDYEVVFSTEGSIVMNSKGYFVVDGKNYYTFEGKRIK